MSVSKEEVRHGNILLIPVKEKGLQRILFGDVSNGVALCMLIDIEDCDFFTLPVDEIVQFAEPVPTTAA